MAWRNNSKESSMVFQRVFLVPLRHSRKSGNPGFPVKTGIQIHIFLVPCFRRACPVLDTGDGVWTPAFAGVTAFPTFYEIIKDDGFVKSRERVIASASEAIE